MSTRRGASPVTSFSRRSVTSQYAGRAPSRTLGARVGRVGFPGDQNPCSHRSVPTGARYGGLPEPSGEGLVRGWAGSGAPISPGPGSGTLRGRPQPGSNRSCGAGPDRAVPGGPCPGTGVRRPGRRVLPRVLGGRGLDAEADAAGVLLAKRRLLRRVADDVRDVRRARSGAPVHPHAPAVPVLSPADAGPGPGNAFRPASGPTQRET